MDRHKKPEREKMVRWDVEFYNELSNDDCIVCLTERQIYLVGQILDQLTWARTRWQGDTTGLDLGAIAADLSYRLAERMTCEKLTDISNIVNQMQLQIANLTTTINNYIDPAPDPAPITADTPINQAVTNEEMQAIGTTIDGCDAVDKDALYGAINTIVRYIHATNIDFLEQLTQAVGNIVEQFQTLFSAFPPTDLLAVDDVSKYINFLIDEMIEEYNATVTEDLLQATVCDLFCLAVDSNCNTNLFDIGNYFGAKVEPTFINFAITYANLVQFAALGTFSGDMYFHYMCYFQLASAAVGDAMGLQTLRPYEYQLAAGQNSPDNDWAIFCSDCPTFTRVYDWSFEQGLGDFEIINGTLESGRIRGEDTGVTRTVNIKMVSDPTWRFIAGRIVGERIGGLANGTNDIDAFMLRPTPGSNTGATGVVQGGFRPNGDYDHCGNIPTVAYVDGINEISIFVRVSDPSNLSDIFLDRVELQFDVTYAKPASAATEDMDICT